MISLKRAFSEMARAQGLVGVVPALVLLTFISEAAIEGVGQVVGLAALLLITGYTTSVMRAVARGHDALIPDLVGDVRDHARRGFVGSALLVFGGMLMALALSPVAVLGYAVLAWFRLPDAAVATAFGYYLFAAIGVAETVFLSRYAYRDSALEAFNLFDSAARFWRQRRLGLSALAFTLTTAFVLIGINRVIARVWEMPADAALAERLQLAFSGEAPITAAAYVAATVAYTLVSVLVQLVAAHVVGQYAAAVYGASDDQE